MRFLQIILKNKDAISGVIGVIMATSIIISLGITVAVVSNGVATGEGAKISTMVEDLKATLKEASNPIVPNNPPVVSGFPTPNNGMFIDLHASDPFGEVLLISPFIWDPDGNVVIVHFWNQLDTSLIGSGSIPSDGGTATVTLEGVGYGDLNSWYIILDDGTVQTQSPIWSFRTYDGPDWPMFGNDPMHSAYSLSKAPDTNNVIRVFPTGDTFSRSPPVVVNNKLYIHSIMNDKLYCYDIETGVEVWAEPIDSSSNYQTSPAVVDGSVYIAYSDNVPSPSITKVACYNAENGIKEWEFDAGIGSAKSSPIVANGFVYVGADGFGGSGKVYCLPKADPNSDGVINSSEVIWEFDAGGNPTSPAVFNGRVYFGSWDDNVYCVDADDGSFIWSFTTGALVVSSPTIAYGNVYIGGSDDNIYCLDAIGNGDGTTSLIWEYGEPGYQRYYNPAVADGKVYFNSADNKLYCYDADPFDDGIDEGIDDGGASYDLIWEFDTGGQIWSSPAVADGKVYIASDSGKIYCLSASDGNTVWEYAVMGPGYGLYFSSPIIADGKMFIHTETGNIYCFEDSEEINLPPQPINPSPWNVCLPGPMASVDLSVTVIDPNPLDIMDVTFKDASDDSVIGTDTNVANGATASVTMSTGFPSPHIYEWYVVITDGEFEIESDTYSFQI